MAEDGREIIDGQTIDTFNKVFKTALVQNNGVYVLDEEKAESTGLTKEQISNLQNAFKDAPQSDLEDLANSEDEDNDGIQVSAADPVTNKIKYILYGIIGATLAETLIQDAYHAGMHAACHKLGKNHSSVKKACKVIGYW